jgi:hypothetical protein
MLALNVAVMAALVVYKFAIDYPIIQYSFLLADYHFGFMKRALIGSVIGLFQDHIPLREVFWLALAAWLVTMALFVVLFKRTFGFSGDSLQLFVFVFGSPFFFKNFFHTHGFFDIYGALFSIVALLIPMTRLYPLIVGAGCAALVLIHHLHFLLYVPAIGVIAVIRFFLMRESSPLDIARGAIAALLPCAAFYASLRYGDAPVPPEVLLAYMKARASDPLPIVNITIWYTSAAEEFAKTAAAFSINGPRLPVFAVLIALHWPVIRFMCALIASLANPLHRRLAMIGIAGVTACYVVIFVFVFDYSRWFSSWAVCMFLVMHALAMLQAQRGTPPAFAAPATRKRDEILGWVLTTIPRFGLMIPF